MIRDAEFLSFDVVVHSMHSIDNRLAYITTFNRPPAAANDERVCAGCGRVMSEREALEQRLCNDCVQGSPR